MIDAIPESPSIDMMIEDNPDSMGIWGYPEAFPMTPNRWSAAHLGMGGGSLLFDDRVWATVSLAKPMFQQVRAALPQVQRQIERAGGQRLALIGAGMVLAMGAVAAGELLWRRSRMMRRGALQGSALSPLLANIYLHPFDLAVTRAGFRLVRFMDDFVVLCPSAEDAQRALRLVQRQLAVLRLALNEQKTQIACFDDGIEFLGQVLTPRTREERPTDGVRSFAEAAELLRRGTRRKNRNSN